jgi:hypothetical protein
MSGRGFCFALTVTEETMTTQEFEDFVLNNRLFLTEKTIGAKADEYARGDRLSNFKKAATLMGCTPERALFGFVAKHIVALSDFINDLEGGKNQTPERWTEKTQDVICYMILLEGLLVERNQQAKVKD